MKNRKKKKTRQMGRAVTSLPPRRSPNLRLLLGETVAGPEEVQAPQKDTEVALRVAWMSKGLREKTVLIDDGCGCVCVDTIGMM